MAEKVSIMEHIAKNLSSLMMGMKINFINMTRYTKYRGTKKAIKKRIINFLSVNRLKRIIFSLLFGVMGFSKLLSDPPSF